MWKRIYEKGVDLTFWPLNIYFYVEMFLRKGSVEDFRNAFFKSMSPMYRYPTRFRKIVVCHTYIVEHVNKTHRAE